MVTTLERHHAMRDEGTGYPRPFRLFWLELSQARLLAAAQGVFVSKLHPGDA